ncbi:MAG TPA: hypothetical protein PKD77_02890 [Rudaea sp.]|jgi:hypothetical protein|nr:hypothetical protein [Rudaea sp.]
MNEHELCFHDLAAGLPAHAVEPLPPDLWPRIAAAHVSRRRRRLWRRMAAGGAALAFAFAVLVSASAWRHAAIPVTDWQARAQALELQLDALPLPATSAPLARLAESEIANLDSSLQAAYDHGAARHDIEPLWQRRSELLDALLSVRQQQPVPARI